MVKQNITMTSIEELFESINYKQVLAVKSEYFEKSFAVNPLSSTGINKFKSSSTNSKF